MKTLKNLVIVALFATILTACASAQDAITDYVTKTDAVVASVQQNVAGFLADVKPLREKKDIVGLKTTADKYIGIWNGLLVELGKVQPPAGAETHYQALTRLLELQRESNEVMSQTLASRIGVILEIQKMKKDGKEQAEIDEFINANSLDRDELIRKTSAIRTETVAVDKTVKDQRAALAGEPAPAQP